jgi:hypothetical protein
MIAAFNRGETLLVSCGENLPPKLMNPQWTIANKSGRDELLIAVDLEGAFDRVLRAFPPEKAQPVAEAKAAPATL